MSASDPVLVLINGPLGCGKSTLGEALAESLDQGVFIDGDALCALNPPPNDEHVMLNTSLSLLLSQHWANGYLRFFVSHAWESADHMDQLAASLQQAIPSLTVRSFLLTLPREENLERIERRRAARAIDETAFEDRQFAHEYEVFSNVVGNELGIPLDASADVEALVVKVKGLLGLT